MRADARAKRRDLVAAAMTLFAERGPEVPVRLIASRAGVGVGTLYRHFPERDDLILGVYEAVWERIGESVETHRDAWDTDPEAAWAGFVADLALLQIGALASQFAPFINESKRLAKTLGGRRDSAREMLDTVLIKAKAAGFVPPDLDPIRFFQGIAAITRPMPESAVVPHDGLAEWLVEVYLRGLRQGG